MGNYVDVTWWRRFAAAVKHTVVERHRGKSPGWFRCKTTSPPPVLVARLFWSGATTQVFFSAVSAPIRVRMLGGKPPQWRRSSGFWPARFKSRSLLFSAARKAAEGLAEELRVWNWKLWVLNNVGFSVFITFFGHVQSWFYSPHFVVLQTHSATGKVVSFWYFIFVNLLHLYPLNVSWLQKHLVWMSKATGEDDQRCSQTQDIRREDIVLQEPVLS